MFVNVYLFDSFVVEFFELLHPEHRSEYSDIATYELDRNLWIAFYRVMKKHGTWYAITITNEFYSFVQKRLASGDF